MTDYQRTALMNLEDAHYRGAADAFLPKDSDMPVKIHDVRAEKWQWVNGKFGVSKGYDKLTDRYIINIRDNAGEDHTIKLKCGCLKSVRGICQTNAMELGVFEHYSRLNHSCEPNVVLKYSEQLEKSDHFIEVKSMQTYALRDIENGEEILTDYLDIGDHDMMSIAARRAKTRKEWGFECQCASCMDITGRCRRLEFIKEFMAHFNALEALGVFP